MATISALSLSEKLQQRQQQDQEAEQNRIQQLQRQHEQSLSELSRAALDTTRTVTASQRELLANALQSDKLLLQQHSEQLKGSLSQLNIGINTLSQQAHRRLKLLMLWPLISTVLLCLIMIGSAALYAAMTVSNATAQSEKILLNQQMKLNQMNSEFCSSPAGRKYCKTSG